MIVTSLEKALASLARALQRASDTPDDDIVRDSCIQRFEYSYELSIKLLRRGLRSFADDDLLERMTHRDLLRFAGEKKLIDDPAKWFVYRELRNETSHAYDEEKAKKVFESIPGFAERAVALLGRLRSLDDAG